MRTFALIPFLFVALQMARCPLVTGGEAQPTPTAATTAPATSTPTAAPATATASATPTGTAAAPANIRAAFGVDHPPFIQPWGVTGNSVGLICFSGAPANGTVTFSIGGATGAPGTVNRAAGADGTGIIPFGISQYGMMNGTVTGLTVNGAGAPFQAQPFSFTVAAQESVCQPPR